MSAARDRLVSRAALLRDAAADPSLISRPPSELTWNEHARLVKASLCISAFTAMEEFVQSRIREVLLRLRGISPASKGLPDAMKSALVVGAFEALTVRIRDSKRFGISDPHAFIVLQTSKIASFGGAGIEPSELALATNGSNLSWSVVESALEAFGVENPSSVVNGVARRLEGGLFVAKDHFESVLTWRHKLAHTSDADIPLGDVRSYVERLTLFCASIDFVMSTAINRVMSAQLAATSPITKSVDVKIRFVEMYNGRWRDRNESSARGHSSHVDTNSAKLASESVGRVKHECVAVRAGAITGLTSSWATPFL